ncbi:DUF5633 domain-containing protein [Anaerococcus prevotii]|uniref:LPXTG-motif cell wall anchor domain protein n=1 Tax=Anaerococcus prevotii ACS-065-V-Col13 TaxID=879305 RepID=F0GU08_9FIRM|nr:DUF5633 domain-containing protein [Anaerococcus prevotii]EGC82695.1 hypothetical protein HMPREF9290_1618 [Anaerococcus prevotii ACS-065-V-Col13]
MKRNKIAAGALALALGFGAVAPVHADDLSDEAYRKDLYERMDKQIDTHSKEAKEFDRLLNMAEEEQIKANEGQGAGTVEEDNTDKPEETESETKPEEEKPSEDKEDEEKPSDDKKDEDNKEDNKDDDKKDEADDEEIAEGPYDTKEEATEAAKKALKAAPTMNEYVVYKDAADKFFFYLRNNSTDGKGKVEEDGNEVVATGKKDDSKESSSPARQADNNAKTGVTGLVSVASILGAASVAYVASKKRD